MWFCINFILSLILVPLFTKGWPMEMKVATFIISLGVSPLLGIPLMKMGYKYSYALILYTFEILIYLIIYWIDLHR